MSQHSITRVFAPLAVLLMGAFALAQSPPGSPADPQGPGEPKQKGPGGFVEGGKKKGGTAAPTPSFQIATSWEYKTLSLAGSFGSGAGSDEEILNKLGAEGWELVAVSASPANKTPMYVFKRPGGRRLVGAKKDGEAGQEPKRGFGGGGFAPGFGAGTFGGSGISTFGPGAGAFGGPPRTMGSFSGTTGSSGTASTFSRPPEQRREPPRRHNYHLVSLKHADALGLAKVLRPVIDPGLQMVAEPRTNTIILAGPEVGVVEVMELLRELDRPMERK